MRTLANALAAANHCASPYRLFCKPFSIETEIQRFGRAYVPKLSLTRLPPSIQVEHVIPVGRLIRVLRVLNSRQVQARRRQVW